jgi:3,4-dihydroxy-2-butanone 4-phosphate synthase
MRKSRQKRKGQTMNELLTQCSGGIPRVQFNRPAALYTGLANLLNEADTAFTVPIDAYGRGVTMAISARDRARTILAAIDSDTRQIWCGPDMFPPSRARMGFWSAEAKPRRSRRVRGSHLNEFFGCDLRNRQRRRHDGAFA